MPLRIALPIRTIGQSVLAPRLGGRGVGIAALAAGLGLLGGCVTERVPVRPWMTGPDPTQPTAPGTAMPGSPAATAAGGTAAPIPARVSTGRARLVIEPLGTIAYDGLTLPVVSPGGKWVASQVGQVSGDEMDGRIAQQSSVIIAQVATAAQPRVIERAMLNRSATASGVLVRTSSASDGDAPSTRTHELALASWSDGSLTTLATNVDHAEHAIMLRDGTLVTIAGDGQDQRLVLEKPRIGGDATRASVTIPQRTLAWPLATPDQRFVGVLAWRASDAASQDAQNGQMELVIIAVPSAAVGTAAPTIVRRVPLSLVGGEASARSVISSIDATPAAAVASGWESTFVLLHTGLRRVVIIDAATGKTAQLASGSLSAALLAGGMLLAESDRLLWQATTAGRAWPGMDTATRAIEKPCIARAVGPDEALIFAPGASTGVSLQLLRVRIGDGMGSVGLKNLP